MTHTEFRSSLVVAVPDATLCVWDVGAGPTVVFAHGGTGTAIHHWGGVVDLVADRVRCVLVDMRGHGGSTLGWGPLGVSRFSSDLAAVLRGLGIPRAMLVGFSVGGNAFIHLAARQPWLASGVLTVGASAKGDPDRVAKIMSGPWPDDLVALEHEVGGAGHWELLRAELATDWGENLDFLAHGLDTVECPVIVVQGMKDTSVLEWQADLLAEAIPDATVVKVDGAGHAVQMVRPDLVAELLLEAVFIRRAMS